MPHEKLRDLAISETGFVFDPYTGSTFTANPTAMTILRALKQDLDRDEVLLAVTSAFDVDAIEAGRDIDTFYASLRYAGVVPTSHRFPGELARTDDDAARASSACPPSSNDDAPSHREPRSSRNANGHSIPRELGHGLEGHATSEEGRTDA